MYSSFDIVPVLDCPMLAENNEEKSLSRVEKVFMCLSYYLYTRKL